ncbi:uncharacterized protein LOC144133417 [Amblyomma americanum]
MAFHAPGLQELGHGPPLPPVTRPRRHPDAGRRHSVPAVVLSVKREETARADRRAHETPSEDRAGALFIESSIHSAPLHSGGSAEELDFPSPLRRGVWSHGDRLTADNAESF